MPSSSPGSPRTVCHLRADRPGGSAPASHSGPLRSAAAGFAPFLSTLSASSADLPHTIGGVPPSTDSRLHAPVPLVSDWTTPSAVRPGPGHRFLRAGARACSRLAAAWERWPSQPARGCRSAGRRRHRVASRGLWTIPRNACGNPCAPQALARFGADAASIRKRGLRGSFMLALVALSGGGLVAAQAGNAEVVRLFTFGLVAIAPVAFMSRFLLSARLARLAVGDLFSALHEILLLATCVTRSRARSVIRQWSSRTGSPTSGATWISTARVELPDGEDTGDDADRPRRGARCRAVHDARCGTSQSSSTRLPRRPESRLENARLHAELRARLEELQVHARGSSKPAEERQRLERNLHDGAQQRLVALSLELRLLEEQLEGDPEPRRATRSGAA